MKKIFTLALALLGFASVTNAATVDEIAPLKHSYVLVCEDLGARPGKGVLFGDGHFLDVTGGSTATNKGSVDLSAADGVLVTEEIAAKYGEYGKHLNFLRLKKTQDVIAMKVTAKSKIIIFYQDNNKDDRYPVFAKDAGLKERFADGVRSERCSGEEGQPAVNVRRIEWTATDDGLVYVGDNNGDMFVSYIIVEANEAPGTPTVKVGPQTFEGGLWFREVTCKANDMIEEGSTEKIPTVVTYTTDGSTPTAASAKYTAPIKCYQDMTVKFQAFQDIMGDGTASDDFICDGADNEANVNFQFDAPGIDADGANVSVTSPYEGAKNFYILNGGEAIEGSAFTLSESATVSAYSQIVNGSYATFTTKKSEKDVYVLNPIKEKKIITVSGNAVVDEEATATSTTGTVYKIENGAITADKMDFFVKNLTFGALANADEAKAQYQVPAGQEAYIQMSNTNITFQVAEGDSVNVKVICSKNSCKNLDAADAEDGSAVTDRMCYVNISGTTYGGEDLKLNPDGNVIEFGLAGGKTYTFQKYSGTGNILISSIEIAPANEAPVVADDPELEAPTGWISEISNGNLAGDNVANYIAKEYPSTTPVGAAIVAGAGKNGSRGIVVKSQDKVDQAWDSQFWINLDETLPVGTKLHVEFDYKADKAGTVGTQSHAAPGAYLHWAAIGNVNFTEEWQHFSADVDVPGEAADMQSIALNLNDIAEGNTYYFDNFGVWVQKPAPVDEWADLIVNGNMEGESMECFYVTEQGVGGPFVAVATNGIGKDGGKAVKVQSQDNPAQDWDTQFFIRLPYQLPAGTKFKVSFDYKADKAGDFDTQAHTEPGGYIHWACIGSGSFTSDWQTYEKEGSISADMSKEGQLMQTIAFNLAKNKVATEFIFDNVKFEVEASVAATLTKNPAVDPTPYPVGIYTLSADQQNGTIFDLQGRRVVAPRKGLYIIDGKKAVVK